MSKFNHNQYAKERLPAGGNPPAGIANCTYQYTTVNRGTTDCGRALADPLPIVFEAQNGGQGLASSVAGSTQNSSLGFSSIAGSGSNFDSSKGSSCGSGAPSSLRSSFAFVT